MPMRARSCGGSVVTSRPSNRIRPDVGATNPAMRANSVVLPAPLGPIRPVIEPLSTVSETPFTATSPPKRLLTATAASIAQVSAGAGRRARPSRRMSPRIPSGAKATVTTRRQPNSARSIPGTRTANELRRLAQPMKRKRAGKRTECRAGAADDRRQQRLDGDPGAIGDVGIDEEEILGIEAPGRAGHGAREGNRGELRAQRIDAQGLRGLLVLPDGNEPRAEARALDPPRQCKRQRHERKRDPEERGAAAELEIRRPHVQADQHAGGAARRLGGVRDNSEHFRKSQRHEGEVGAAQPGAEAQIADGGADQGSGREAERETRPTR